MRPLCSFIPYGFRDRKHFSFGFLLVVSLGVFTLFAHVARSADLSPDLQRYVGTWQARFKGTTFLIVKLREENSKLSGSVVHATHVQADPNGNLLAVGITNVEDKIVEAHATNGKLIFNVAESAGNDNLVRCELTITTKNAGHLQMIVPAPAQSFKPWKVDRVSTR